VASNVGAVGCASSLGETFTVFTPPGTNYVYDVGLAYGKVRYFWSGAGTQILRTEKGSDENIGGRLLSDFHFEYLDKDFKPFVPANQIDRNGVSFIRISYTETKDGKNMSFSTAVYLRNNR
jgi:hypothetical protein